MDEKENIQNKMRNATKWSSVTEIAAKLVSPLTNIVLARILTPDAFGVVATVTMIISFADMFTDSGFQKYLVQHEFENEDEKHNNANVAFWTNFVISLLMLAIIITFREQLATMVGNAGLGNVLAIACMQLPLTSFSSIQMALYRRNFDYKTLFLVRMVSVFIPFIVTLPLALLGWSYWALITGAIVIQLSNAIILTVKSKWKPQLFYSGKILKEMFSFSVWSLIEAISIWLTTWVDSFIIGGVLSQYYLGLYKTSTTMVNTLMALITSSLIPVLFSTLSRLQNDDDQFKRIYFKFQRIVSILIFPIGIGVYLFSDLATQILLGSQWEEASGVIGIWALTSSITIVLSNFASEVYRAKGRPRLSFMAQMIHLIVLVPTCIISAKYGFWPLVYARSWIRMQFVLVNVVIMHFVMRISINKTINNILPAGISAIVMGMVGYILKQMNYGIGWDILTIFLCLVCYSVILLLFSEIRKDLFRLVGK